MRWSPANKKSQKKVADVYYVVIIWEKFVYTLKNEINKWCSILGGGPLFSPLPYTLPNLPHHHSSLHSPFTFFNPTTIAIVSAATVPAPPLSPLSCPHPHTQPLKVATTTTHPCTTTIPSILTVIFLSKPTETILELMAIIIYFQQYYVIDPVCLN